MPAVPEPVTYPVVDFQLDGTFAFNFDITGFRAASGGATFDRDEAMTSASDVSSTLGGGSKHERTDVGMAGRGDALRKKKS